MSEQIEVEHLGGHDYLVRARGGGEVVESRFRATPDALARLGVSGADERRLIEHTAAYLLEHQPLVDLPPMVDLDDVAAAFDDFPARLRERMAGGSADS
jgi:hypothetical protein